MATCEGASTDSDIADLPDIPFHPPVTYTFPKHEFGKKHVKNAHVSARGLLSGNGSCLQRCHVFGFHQVVTEFSGVNGIEEFCCIKNIVIYYTININELGV